jgi:transposase
MLNQDFITAVLALPEFDAFDGAIQQNGSLIIEVSLLYDLALCPACKQPCSFVLAYKDRLTRDLSISGRATFLSYKQRRFRCENCKATFYERLQSIDSVGAHYTIRYEEWICQQVRQSSIKAVAIQEGLSWDGVQYILNRVAKRRRLFDKPQVVRWVAIDEIALKKGHKQYALVISAPEQGRILAVLEGRKKQDLTGWLKENWTIQQRMKVEVVTIDMWDAYFYAVLESLPSATIVIDRFHVEKNLNEAISKLRRKIQKELPREMNKEMKGARWLIVRNYDELDEDSKHRLDEILGKCPQLAVCHWVKEEFRDWYEEEYEVEVAGKKLEEWKEVANSLGSTAMSNFIKTLDNWGEWILNYFDERASNGFAEGINNALKLLKRKAYGFRNFDNFRLRVLLLHTIS